MDEGSAGYTEFDMSADVMNYMIEHPNLISENVYQGLIHSHNNMSTFFSGTDTGTLLSEGSDVNHFVSLIVNNAGKYTAGITRRLTVSQKVNEEYTYPSWNDTSISGTREFTASKTYVQWFNLDITIDEIPNDGESEIINRIKEIRKNKVHTPVYINHTPSATPTFKSQIQNPQINTPKTPVKEVDNLQGNLFNDDEDEFDVNYNIYHFSDDTIQGIVKQLITLSLILPNDKAINIEEWAKNMDEIFDRRFTDVIDFENVAVNIADFLLNDIEDEEALLYLTPRQITAVVAYDVKEALSKLPEGKYMNSLISICDDYIY